MNNESHVLDARVIGFSTAAAILGATFAIALSASAATDDTFSRGSRECDSDHRAAVEEALEQGDYAAWKELTGTRGRKAEVVTEENFPTFVKMRQAMEAGDAEQAAALREEIGLPERGEGRGRGMRHHPNR